ncbi:substrate-binding domain-containing protein [Dongshaea marina]|uniref:substrate-binding domain-containing protein n=1 Tax=Dongshaea marina TaxID=2047966 RepID=UPI00131F460E|nr:substrate-binding domain-containing protein [Dongshaea marina]
MPPATEFNFYLDVGKGIKSVATRAGYESFMFAPQNDNPAQQMKMIREAMRRKVDAIILSTHDPKSAAPIVKDAVSQGIIVVIVNSDNPEFTTPVHAVVGYLQRKGTRAIGNYLLKKVGKEQKRKVGIIEGAPGYHTIERTGGFIDGIEDSNLEVVSRLNGKWNTEGGYAAALDMFKAHPDIEIVFAANDFEIIGVASALEALKIQDVILLGNDGDPAALERIADGQLTATVNTDPIRMGKIVMQVVIDALQGKFTGGFVETPTVIVDEDNVENYWDPPEMVKDDDFSEFRVFSEAQPGLVSKEGGLYVDIIRRIFETQDIKVKLYITPYARAKKLVEMKQGDAILGAYRGEEEGFIFPQWHYSANVISVLYKTKSVDRWSGQDTLAGKKLSLLKNYDYDKYLYVPIIKIESRNRHNAIALLHRDRISFFLDDGVILRKELQPLSSELGLEVSDYQIQDVMLLKLYLAFSNTKKGAEFSRIFDDGIAQLLASGELKVLFDKWGLLHFPSIYSLIRPVCPVKGRLYLLISISSSIIFVSMRQYQTLSAASMVLLPCTCWRSTYQGVIVSLYDPLNLLQEVTSADFIPIA